MSASRGAAAAALLVAMLPPARQAAAQARGVDVQSYHFRIDIPDTGSTIRGLATVLFETRAGYDDTLRLDLVGMNVRRVFDVHTLTQLPIWYDGRMLKIGTRRLDRRRPMGVVVEYSGAPQDGLIIRQNARGRRSAFGDNWPNRARYWLPTVDHPSDKARVLWSIQVPRGWRGVANMPECRRATGCRETAPIPTYTMVLGATEMTRSDHRPAVSGNDTVPIQVWAYPEDSAFADSVPFRRATEIVETMQRLVGPYPYGALLHVQSSTRYGGMENSTVIFYAEQPYVRRTMGEGVVRHETAHQWFGDAVTPREWAHLWLSEGFATYFGLVVGAALDGDSVLQRGMRGAAQTYLRSRVTDRPLVDSTTSDPNEILNANSYQKGAWVLHMLRQQVGDPAFFRGVREYYRAYRDSSVLSAQFQRAMERAAGANLGWFFEQWLRQPGYPQLDVGWDTTTPGHAQLSIRQVQPEAWGRFSVPRVPVEFVVGGEVVARRTFALDARYAERVAGFTLPAPPDEVRIDPDGTLLLTATVSRRAGP